VDAVAEDLAIVKNFMEMKVVDGAAPSGASNRRIQ
jgi:hypothetical protein